MHGTSLIVFLNYRVRVPLRLRKLSPHNQALSFEGRGYNSTLLCIILSKNYPNVKTCKEIGDLNKI
jgi:hypothetical protein